MTDLDKIELAIKKDVAMLKSYLGPETNRTNTGISWWGVTRSGKAVSLFYDIQPRNARPGVIEFLDKRGFLKLNTDDFGIGFIEIKDISKFFIQHKF